MNKRLFSQKNRIFLLFLLIVGILIWSSTFSPPLQAIQIETSDTRTSKNLNPDESVTLNEAIIVEEAHILLGDLFTNVGNKSKIKIAYSPQPGMRSQFDAKWLYRVARAYGLKWRPLTRKTRAFVERDSQEIYRDEIEDTIKTIIKTRGYDGDFEIAFGNPSMKIRIPTNMPSTIDVAGLSINTATGRFVATLVIPANTPGAKRFRLTGRVHNLLQIPVVNRRISRGDIIRRDDIEWISVRKRSIRRDYIQNEEDIIGMAARRYISAQSPLSVGHLQRPQLVKRGGLVTISLINQTMSLKTQGRAIDTGGLGDIVRVKNSKSKKIIEAKVIGASRVKVNLLQETSIN
jgi:flagella basal body P-ring formation protein FlgA